MKKEYQYSRGTEAIIQVRDGSVNITCRFTNGDPNSGRGPKLITDKEFVMRALEKDPRFGREYKLVKTYGMPTEAVHINTAGRIRNAEGEEITAEEAARLIAEAQLQGDTSGEELQGDTSEKKTTTKSVKKVKKVKKATGGEELQGDASESGTAESETATDEADAADGVTVENTIGTWSDAIAYFAEMGEAFESEDELKALMEKYKVSFPALNL